MNRALYIEKITRRVRDSDSRLEPSDYERGLDASINALSVDLPRRIVSDLTAEEFGYLPMPTGWADGFSQVCSVELPVDLTPRSLLPKDDWEVRTTPKGSRVSVRGMPAGGVARLIFTSKYQLTESSDGIEVANTIPDHYQDGLIELAASYLLTDLANYYAADSDASMDADSVDRSSKSQRYASRANVLKSNYSDFVKRFKAQADWHCSAGSVYQAGVFVV